MRKDTVIGFILLLSAPAMADDLALTAFSWLITGGPAGPYFAALWGVKRSEKLRSIDQRLAIVLTVLFAFVGYCYAGSWFFSLEISRTYLHQGIGIFQGPVMLLGGALAGRIPSLVYELAYRKTGVDPEAERRSREQVPKL